jgi:hypothetical protein
LSNARRVEELLRLEQVAQKPGEGRVWTAILGRDTRLLAKEVMRLRAQLDAA